MTRPYYISSVVSSKQGRDGATGQFTETGNWERPCRCGHQLAVHSAAKFAGERPCFISDNGTDKCECRVFRPARKGRKVVA